MSRGEGLRWNLRRPRDADRRFETAGEELVQRGLRRAGPGVDGPYEPGQASARVVRVAELPGVLCGFVTYVGRDGDARLVVYARATIYGARDPDGQILPTHRWAPQIVYRVGLRGEPSARHPDPHRSRPIPAHQQILESARMGRR